MIDTIDKMQSEINRLRGERKVLADLLSQAIDVVCTFCDPESTDESLMIQTLVQDGDAAIMAVRANLALATNMSN